MFAVRTLPDEADITAGAFVEEEKALSITDRLARLVYAILWLIVILVALVLVRAVVAGGWPLRAPIDPRTGTAAFAVETDKETGCQYVVTPWGGIMPRTGADGRQVCTTPPR